MSVCQHGAMARSRLGADEHVLWRTRTHGSTLVRPALSLVVLSGVLGVGTALVPSAYRPAGQYVVAAAVLALAWVWSVLPFLRWRSRTYTITNQRLLTRQGVLARQHLELPLSRIAHVSYQRKLADRLLGCGTLYVLTSAEGALVLEDLPEVERVHLTLSRMLFDGSSRSVPTPAAAPSHPSWPAPEPLPQPSWHYAGRRR